MDLEKLKQKVKKILCMLPIRNIIIMESNPDFTDNTKLVFDKLIEKKVNEKYKIVWFVNNSKKFNHIKMKNVKFISVNSKYNIFKKIKKIYYNFSAKIIIDCNKYIQKVRDNQFRLHLTHGNTIKKVENYFGEVGDIDYILELGDFFKEKNSELYKKPECCFLSLGLPRNDELFSNIILDKILPNYNGKKIIVWLPTYRNHKDNNNYKDSLLKYGLPSIENSQDFIKIDKVLEENNVVILLKLHPAQDRKKIESFKCSNIKIITDEELISNNLNLYKLLSVSDALITDYSSVYYDYLLTKKPIALAITDIEEYKENVGFVYDYYEVIKGEYVYNSDELATFIKNVAEGKDNHMEERIKCLNLYHSYHDNKSSERVYEIIKKYL